MLVTRKETIVEAFSNQKKIIWLSLSALSAALPCFFSVRRESYQPCCRKAIQEPKVLVNLEILYCQTVWYPLSED